MAAYEKAGKSNEWYTPKYVFDAIGLRFDLDVAAPPEGPRYVPADHWFHDRALERNWHGLVWMNPPFEHQANKILWLTKFFDHGNGIALVPDRTSAPWFQQFFDRADIALFVAPKIKFERPDGTLGESPGTGTALLAKGEIATQGLMRAALKGLGSLAVPLTGLTAKEIDRGDYLFRQFLVDISHN